MHNPHTKYFFVIGIFLLIGCISSGWYYFSSKTPVSAPAEIVTPTPPPTPVVESVPSTTPLVWSNYVNERYGFSLDVPAAPADVAEYPDERENCSREFADFTIDTPFVTTASISDGRMLIAVICEPFSETLSATGTAVLYPYPIEDGEVISTSTSATTTSITHTFTTSSGYTWTILQTPLDENHYLEIGYSFGNSNYANNETTLTDEDFQKILQSVTLPK